MYLETLQAVNITTKKARDETDVLILERAIEESKHGKIAVIIGEDMDLLGMQCSLAYGQCNGQACLNASPYQSDVNEDAALDLEILENLETNIVEDETEEKLEILQLQEDDDVDEEEN
ncbi:hypothetical protein RN001_004074 [Aquatica leii]|uniref:Uncharacterized protein n=1 Tax=Aquatica leii TaxID=1421715 RepID=A0AAN7SRT4_9COLE|nr:hypothetical protein RN001_004074 [Aquatica leii]